MIRQTKVLILLVCLIGLSKLANCDNQWQIHQLDAASIMTEKHMLEGANLRTHNAVSSSQNSILGAIMGFLFGPLIFFMAFVCLWFNEKRAVIDYRRLKLA